MIATFGRVATALQYEQQQREALDGRVRELTGELVACRRELRRQAEVVDRRDGPLGITRAAIDRASLPLPRETQQRILAAGPLQRARQREATRAHEHFAASGPQRVRRMGVTEVHGFQRSPGRVRAQELDLPEPGGLEQPAQRAFREA